MVTRAGLANEDMEFVQFHPTGMAVWRYEGMSFVCTVGGMEECVLYNVCRWYGGMGFVCRWYGGMSFVCIGGMSFVCTCRWYGGMSFVQCM